MALFFYSPAFILKGGRWIKCVRRGTHWGGRRLLKGLMGRGGSWQAFKPAGAAPPRPFPGPKSRPAPLGPLTASAVDAAGIYS